MNTINPPKAEVTGSNPVGCASFRPHKTAGFWGFGGLIERLYFGETCRFLSYFDGNWRKFLGNIWAAVLRGGLVGLLMAVSVTACLAKPPAAGERPALGRTSGYWATVTKVVDGDTFWADGVKYRDGQIDTPETHDDPKHGYKCDAERRLGEMATQEAEALLLGRKVWIKPSGRWGRYGRPIVRTRYARGKWYHETMLQRRLAAPYLGRKHRWCEELEY